ncbi:MAG: TonB-dependent receptor [Saprospiraceae bacterium]|nr:TonB-dependent receptor [Saprospiraceae bacterium]
MSKRVILLFVSAVFCQCIGAQAYVLRGQVTTPGGNPVSQAHLSLSERGPQTISTPDGSFALAGLDTGRYVLRVTCLGLRSVEHVIEVPQDSVVKITMTELVYLLPGATISEGSLTGGIQRLQAMPGAAYYLSATQLGKMQHTDINRVLGAVPGLNIQEEDGFGLRPNIGIRGSGAERSSKITVMEDGVLAAPAPYAAPAAYYFPTAGRMHAIEVLKGASQVKYGPFTTGGALNLLSTPIPERLAGMVRLSAGSFGLRNLHATIGDTHGRFAYLAETFQYRSTGYKDVVNGETGFDKQDYLVKLRWTTRPDAPLYQALSFKAGQTHETSNETYLGLTDADFVDTPLARYAASQHDNMRAKQEQWSLRHSILLDPAIAITTTAYINQFVRNWYKLDKVRTKERSTGIATVLANPASHPRALQLLKGSTTLPGESLQAKANNRSYQSEGVQSAIHWTIDNDRFEHHVEAGIRVHRDHMDRFQWVDSYAMADSIMQLSTAGTPGTESNRIERAKATSGYLQYRLSTHALTLYPGIRYEHVTLTRQDYGKEDPQRSGQDLKTRSNQVAAWLPGIGFDLALSPQHRIIGGVHKGFAPPGSNEGAKPEESVNYELGWRSRNGVLTSEVIAFLHDYQNLLGADLGAAGGNGSTDTYNGGAAHVGGFEVLVSYAVSKSQLDWHVPLQLSYSYTYGAFDNAFDSTFDGWGLVEQGDQLPYLAPHRISVEAGLVHPALSTYMTMRYTSAMRTQSGRGPLLESLSTDAHLVIDWSVQANLSEDVRLVGTVRNLTNARYIVARRPAGARPGMPRSAEIGLAASF